MRSFVNKIPQKAQRLSFYMVSQGLRVIIPIIIMPIYTRLIPPGDYGILDMFSIVMIIGLGLGNWGLQNSFDRYFFEYADDKKKQLRLLGTLTTFSILCLCAVLLGVFFFRLQLSLLLAHSEKWGYLLVLVLVSGYVSYINTFFFYYLRNTDNAAAYMKIDLLNVFISTGLSLYFVLVLKMGIWGLPLSQVVTLVVLFCLFVLRFGISTVFVFDLEIFKVSFKFGWPLMTKVLLTILNMSIDKLMVGTIISLSALGVYSRAQSISYGVFIIMTTVQNVYAPEWNRILFAKPGETIKSLSKSFTEYVCIVTIPAAVIILFCKDIFTMLLSKEYHGAMPLLVILTFHYSLQAFGKVQGAVGAYLKATKFMAVTMLISYPVSIGLNLILIPRFGATGSVISALIIGITMLVISQMHFRKYYKTNYELKRLAAIYGVLAIGCFATIAGINRMYPTVVDLSLRIFLFMVFIVILVRSAGRERILRIIRMIMPLKEKVSPAV